MLLVASTGGASTFGTSSGTVKHKLFYCGSSTCGTRPGAAGPGKYLSTNTIGIKTIGTELVFLALAR